MQTPQENPEGYARSSAIANAAKLTRPLLVIHGTTDDNVHFANSLGLVQALFRAGKEVELLPVAATHMTPDPEVALALHRKQLAFFRRHLAGVSQAGGYGAGDARLLVPVSRERSAGCR